MTMEILLTSSIMFNLSTNPSNTLASKLYQLHQLSRENSFFRGSIYFKVTFLRKPWELPYLSSCHPLLRGAKRFLPNLRQHHATFKESVRLNQRRNSCQVPFHNHIHLWAPVVSWPRLSAQPHVKRDSCCESHRFWNNFVTLIAPYRVNIFSRNGI